MIQVLDSLESIIQIKSVRYKSEKVVSICGNFGQILKLETPKVFLQQAPRQDSGITGAEKVSDVFENDTIENSQESIPGKAQFQKSEGCRHGPPVHPSCFPATSLRIPVQKRKNLSIMRLFNKNAKILASVKILKSSNDYCEILLCFPKTSSLDSIVEDGNLEWREKQILKCLF